MNCQDLDQLLDDFVDGALDEPANGRVAAHLQTCPSCRNDETRLRSVVAAAAALDRSLAPGRGLWPEIAATITADREERRLPSGRRPLIWAALLAAAAALLAFTAVVTVRMLSSGLVGHELGTVEATSANSSADVARAQATLLAARQQLLAAVAARRASLSPQTIEVVEKNLRIIESAVNEMQTALSREPDNPALPRLLVVAYQQEIDLLQRTATLPGES
jgi:anti-sigma factor RsiW